MLSRLELVIFKFLQDPFSELQANGKRETDKIWRHHRYSKT